MEESDIKYGKASARIMAEFRFDQKEKYCYSREIYKKGDRINSPKDLENIVAYFEENYLLKDKTDSENNFIEMSHNSNIPIFVNYGVNRLVLKTPFRIKKTEDYGQFAAFEKAIENQIAFSKLFEWFLEQELY